MSNRNRYGYIDENGDPVYCEDCGSVPAQRTVETKDGDWLDLCHDCAAPQGMTIDYEASVRSPTVNDVTVTPEVLRQMMLPIEQLPKSVPKLLLDSMDLMREVNEEREKRGKKS